MRQPKYALEPLVQLRTREVDDASRALGHAVRVREDAQRERRRAEGEEAHHEAEVRASRESEDAALVRGDLRAVDLMRADAWEVRVRAEHGALADRVASAAGMEQVRTDAERAARDGLARRLADAEVVERDRSRFLSRQKLEGEAREDEAAEEIFGAGPKR